MSSVVVVGSQWGDEGKGKIVDWLADRADLVARFQGGHNAGHTIQTGDAVYKLSLLPSGVTRGTLSVIGNGVVIDPWALFEEIGRVGAQGLRITPEILRIAENATVILPSLTAPGNWRAARTPSAPPAAASASPMRTRSRAGRSASST